MSNNIEIRKAVTELRANKESRSIEGYAALYDSPSDAAGWYTEVIAPGAFKRALERSPDVVALFNHNENYVLGRTSAGTLELWEDEKGLRYRVKDMPDSRADVLEAIERRDVNGNSFAFTVKEDTWQERDGKTIRTLKEFDILYDVGPVTYPFYKSTNVFTNSDAAKRSFDQWAEQTAKQNGKNNGEQEQEQRDLKAFNEWLERTLKLRKEFL